MGAAQAMEGSERPARFRFENTRWIHVSTRGAGVAPTTLGWRSWSGRPQYPLQPSAITRAPGAGVPATKARRRRAEKSPIGASRMRHGSPSGDSSTAPAMRILPCGLRPCPPVAGSLAVRNGRGGLIDLDRVLKQATIRIDHGAAPLVQPEPGTLVTAEPEPGLELQGGDTIRVPGRDVNGHEPDLQGQGAAVHDRACGRRGLLPAGRTFPARPAPFQFPAPVMAAGGAHEAVGPASGGERPGTGGFIGKARLEGGAGHRAVIFPAAGHIGTLYEQDADDHRKLNISSNRTQRDKPFQ